MMPDPTNDLLDLRRELPDWRLGASAMPAIARADWLHLLQVVAEVQSIPHKVREPMIVQIRLAWWRELIEEIYAGRNPRPHPLAKGLARIIQTRRLPQTLWEGWLGALAERFDPPEGADVPSAEEWLFAMAAVLLGAPLDTPPEAEPWQEMGRLWTLLHTLRVQAFASKPDHALIQAAARSGMQRKLPQPAMGQGFWHAHEVIARHYLRAASNAKSANALQAALRPSNVVLPLKLLFA